MVETPIGNLPTPKALTRRGLDLSDETPAEPLAVDRDGWRANLHGQEEFFARVGDRLPTGIREQQNAIAHRLRARYGSGDRAQESPHLGRRPARAPG